MVLDETMQALEEIQREKERLTRELIDARDQRIGESIAERTERNGCDNQP